MIKYLLIKIISLYLWFKLNYVKMNIEEKIFEVTKNLSFLNKDLLVEIIGKIIDNINFDVESFVYNKFGNAVDPVLKTLLYVSFLKKENGTGNLSDFVLYKDNQNRIVMYLNKNRKQFMGNDLLVDFNIMYEQILGDKYLILNVLHNVNNFSIQTSIHSLRKIIDDHPRFKSENYRGITSFILGDINYHIEYNNIYKDTTISDRTKTLRRNKLFKRIYKGLHPLDVEWMEIDDLNRKIGGYWSTINNFKLIDKGEKWSLYEKISKDDETIPYLDDMRLLFEKS